MDWIKSNHWWICILTFIAVFGLGMGAGLNLWKADSDRAIATAANSLRSISEGYTRLAASDRDLRERIERGQELSKSMAQLQLSLKASQSATELAASVAVILGTVAIVEGLILIFRN